MRNRIRMGSVSRRMSERAHEQDPDSATPAGELFSRLRQVVEEVAKAAFQPEAGTQQEPHGLPFSLGGRPGRVVFGYSVRTGLDGGKAELFGDIPPGPQSPKPAARAPIVDVFVEGSAVCVIAELPGVADADIACSLDGQSLVIETSGGIRYRKTVLLPDPVDAASLTRRCQNGILEVRLIKLGAA